MQGTYATASIGFLKIYDRIKLTPITSGEYLMT